MADICGAEKRSGGQCGRPAGWGTDHAGIGRCKLHGGSTPTHERAAQTEIARQAVVKLALVAEDEALEIDPRDALARELVRCHLAVEFLGRMVNDLDRVYGDTYHADGGITGRALPHVVWVMWGQERDRLRQVAADAAKAGVEARRMELAEQTAKTVAGLLRAVFSDPDLGLSAKRQEAALVVAARHLRQLVG